MGMKAVAEFQFIDFISAGFDLLTLTDAAYPACRRAAAPERRSLVPLFASGAVTLGFLATRRIEPVMAGVYIVAQLLGAMAAAYALKGIMPEELFDSTRGGGQSVSSAISTGQAIAVEEAHGRKILDAGEAYVA